MESWWEMVWETLRNDFSDVPDARQFTRIVVRLTVAALLGGVLGYERERTGKQAGLRTHMIVSVGAAMFVLTAQLSGDSHADMSRVVQGLITGIGFLGAGTITKDGSSHEVYGLTTAAGIWLTAAIGVAVGVGRETSAVICTVLAIVILALLPQSHHASSAQSK